MFVENHADVIERVDSLTWLAFEKRAVQLRVVADSVGDLLDLSGEASKQTDDYLCLCLIAF